MNFLYIKLNNLAFVNHQDVTACDILKYLVLGYSAVV